MPKAFRGLFVLAIVCARLVVREGIAALKLKMSGKIDLDLKRVAKVREAVGVKRQK